MTGSKDALVLEFPDLEERFGEQIVHTAAHVLNRNYLRGSNSPFQDPTIHSRIRGLPRRSQSIWPWSDGCGTGVVL